MKFPRWLICGHLFSVVTSLLEIRVPFNGLASFVPVPDLSAFTAMRPNFKT